MTESQSPKILTLSLPLYYDTKVKGVPKQLLINLNWYRNAHFILQNKVKQHYHKLVHDQIDSSIKMDVYSTQLKLFYKNKNSDMANCTALLEKFVLDALQEFGVTSGDTVKEHVHSSYLVADQDKENPRVEVTIKEV